MVLNRVTLIRSAALIVTIIPVIGIAGPHKELDLKKFSDDDGGERQVSICARPSPGIGVPGHMFVALSEKLPIRERTYLALGHTTTATPLMAVLSYKGFLGTVDGYIGEEKYTSSKERCLVINVNRVGFAQAMSLVKPDISKVLPGASLPSLEHPVLLAYSLGDSDCMALAINVARVFQNGGVNVPERKTGELPMNFVRRLIDTN